MTTTKRGRQAKQGARKRHKTTADEQFRPANDEETAMTSLLGIAERFPQKAYVACAGNKDIHGVMVGGHEVKVDSSLVRCLCSEHAAAEHSWLQVLNLEEFYEHCTGGLLPEAKRSDEHYWKALRAGLSPEQALQGSSSLAEVLKQQSQEYGGAGLVAQQGYMYWSGEKEWFLFEVQKYDARSGRFHIFYPVDEQTADVYISCAPIHMGTEMPQGRPPNLPAPMPKTKPPAAPAASAGAGAGAKKASGAGASGRQRKAGRPAAKAGRAAAGTSAARSGGGGTSAGGASGTPCSAAAAGTSNATAGPSSQGDGAHSSLSVTALELLHKSPQYVAASARNLLGMIRSRVWGQSQEQSQEEGQQGK